MTRVLIQTPIPSRSFQTNARSSRRALLQELFGYADERVARARERGRKGWLAALRDAAALKTAYAFGLRRRELVMLDLADFGANPHAPELGDYGVVYVRWARPARAARRSGAAC
jgi:site-specific recombinase XerD